MGGRAKICCSCSKFTSVRSPEDEDLGCCLAVVRVDIKVLSRGIVELGGRGRERERERERELLSTNKGTTQIDITSGSFCNTNRHTFLGTVFAQ